MKSISRHVFPLALLVFLQACSGGGSGPTTPSAQIPNVVGTYTGPLTASVNGVVLMTFDARFVVGQTDAQVTVTGSLSLGGQPIALFPISSTVNTAGVVNAPNSATTATGSTDATCGLLTVTDTTLTFSGNILVYLEHVQTGSCGVYTFAGTLTK